MKLILMRHAQAESGADDAKRPLSLRGQEDSLLLARFLYATGWSLDESLASPLLRARQSQQILSQKLKELGGLASSYSERVEEKLKPGLPSIGIVAEILEAKDKRSCMLWILHAPDVASLASAFTGAPVSSYYFTPGSMLALNLTLPELTKKATQIWQNQPEYLRDLF